MVKSVEASMFSEPDHFRSNLGLQPCNDNLMMKECIIISSLSIKDLVADSKLEKT